MQRKKLTASQRELIRMKREKIDEAIMLVRNRQQEFSGALERIAEELGIPQEEMGWKLDKNDEYLEKEEDKKPDLTTVGGKKNKK